MYAQVSFLVIQNKILAKNFPFDDFIFQIQKQVGCVAKQVFILILHYWSDANTSYLPTVI